MVQSDPPDRGGSDEPLEPPLDPPLVRQCNSWSMGKREFLAVIKKGVLQHKDVGAGT